MKTALHYTTNAVTHASGGHGASTCPSHPFSPTRHLPARHRSNPYPAQTGYALVFDLLAAHCAGLHRDQLTRDYARCSGKPLTQAKYDVAIVLSAKDSSTGPRHRSARDGYWVRRECDHVQIVIDGERSES